MNFIETIYAQSVDEIDGVLYQDIKELLDDKEQLENLLFTTKIVFVNNEELVEFINKLMEYGYDDMALDYVENIYDKVPLDFSGIKKDENPNKQ